MEFDSKYQDSIEQIFVEAQRVQETNYLLQSEFVVGNTTEAVANLDREIALENVSQANAGQNGGRYIQHN